VTIAGVNAGELFRSQRSGIERVHSDNIARVAGAW
jgi:hypothetical protein